MSVSIIFSNPYNNPLTQKLLDKCKLELEQKRITYELTMVDDLNFTNLSLYIGLIRKSSKLFIKTENSIQNINQNQANEYSNSLIMANQDIYISDIISLRNSEISKLNNSNLVILIFPLIQLFCPSKVKSWLELIFEEQLSFDIEKGNFLKKGKFFGRKCLIISNNDYNIRDFGPKGKFLLSVEELLEPITYGILAISGFLLLQSVIIYENDNEYNQKIEESLNEVKLL